MHIRFTTEHRGGALLIRGALFEKRKPATYRHLDEPVERWAARTLLAGNYTDEHGDPATITAGGTATLPGQPPFTFKVVLDMSEACCDYVDTSRKSKTRYEDRIAYHWRGDVLELYGVTTNPDAECPIAAAKTAFVTLRRRG